MVPLPSSIVLQPIDLLVYVVVVAITIVNVENVVDLEWSPSNLCIHPHQSANVPQPLETLCHVPF
jgi:hypothetical protein